ncbi:MAG TPA: TonB-dependent receptor [Spongiibacteraceae bacterium]|nr:TonB-dependent receptor [Spongiibacteraceae bacterium]
MNNKRLICIAVGLYCSGITGVAQAAPVLEEVIITAQKTEETLQSVPISIQALDAKTLENNAVNSFSDIKALVPAVRFTPYPTAQQNLLITIRGIPPGAIELTQDTPTAVHINGVYIARGNGLDMSVADLQNIEILRGPQGTLYGRNATAGAVNLITVKPTGDFNFKQQITVAQQDQRISKTSINFPITDQLYAKVAYMYDIKEGYVDNNAPGGNDFGDREANAARIDLRWVPTADLTIDYSYDWSAQRYYMTPGQCMEKGNATGSSAAISAAMDPNQCSSHFLDKLTMYGHTPKNKVTADGHTLTAEWDLNKMTLKSITGYRSINDNYYGILLAGGANLIAGSQDTGALPGGYSFDAQSNHTKQNQLSQEFQIYGDATDHLTYNAGLYYFKEDGSETKGLGAALVASLPGTSIVSLNGPRDLDVTNESAAVYGQLTWTPPILDDNLKVIPGVRYTEDRREASMFERVRGTIYNGTPIPSSAADYIGDGVTGAPAKYDNNFSEVTPSLTVQYQINPDLMTYGKYVKGYKSGGTAVRSSTTLGFEKGFDPEKLTSLEFGAKSAWFDQRVQANIAVFRSNFTDQQVSVRNPAAVGPASPTVPFDIVNAGESTYDGVEFDMRVAVTDELRLSANYAYLHFAYDKVEDPVTGTDVTQFYHNVVPNNSYSIAADYSFPDLGFANLDANLTYSYVDAASGPFQDPYSVTGNSATQTAPTDRRQFVTPSYGLWNARLALSDIKVGPSGKGSLSVALWCKNLTDEEYQSYNYLTVPAAAQYQAFWGEPRTLGLDVIYQYE